MDVKEAWKRPSSTLGYDPDNPGMKIKTVHFPPGFIDLISEFIKLGITPNFSEYVRFAVKKQLDFDVEVYYNKLLG